MTEGIPQPTEAEIFQQMMRELVAKMQFLEQEVAKTQKFVYEDLPQKVQATLDKALSDAVLALNQKITSMSAAAGQPAQQPQSAVERILNLVTSRIEKGGSGPGVLDAQLAQLDREIALMARQSLKMQWNAVIKNTAQALGMQTPEPHIVIEAAPE